MLPCELFWGGIATALGQDDTAMTMVGKPTEAILFPLSQYTIV